MESGTSIQAEQLKSIGTRLSEERQKQAISLEEVAAKTYIPLRLLNAIEGGRMDLLPEPVFIQGFIRRYADVLGLDGLLVSKEFPIEVVPEPLPEIPQPSIHSTPANGDIPQVSELLQPVALESSNAPAEPRWYLQKEPKSYLPLIGIGAAGVGLLTLIAVSVFNRPTTVGKLAPPPTAPASPQPKAAAPNAAASPNVAASVAPSPTASVAVSPPPSEPVAVKMNVTEDSWVQVLVDGQSVYEGTLTKGTQKLWTGKKQVVVDTGNAGGVSLSYNNGVAKPLGGLGEVKSAAFPPMSGQ